eukprot:jgi/Botrbrau1/17204/Bobra.0817s0002.1
MASESYGGDLGQVLVEGNIAEIDMAIKLKLALAFLGRGYRVRLSFPKGRKPDEALATFQREPYCSIAQQTRSRTFAWSRQDRVARWRDGVAVACACPSPRAASQMKHLPPFSTFGGMRTAGRLRSCAVGLRDKDMLNSISEHITEAASPGSTISTEAVELNSRVVASAANAVSADSVGSKSIVAVSEESVGNKSIVASLGHTITMLPTEGTQGSPEFHSWTRGPQVPSLDPVHNYKRPGTVP